MPRRNHDYRSCTDEDCDLFPCRVYRDGYSDGAAAGYALGEATGYTEGYSQGCADTASTSS